jgi:hypothetical protein
MGGFLPALAVAIVLAMTPLRPDYPLGPSSTDHSSFFDGTDLAGAGWSGCPTPVTWTVDARALQGPVARREIRRLKRAWSAWSGASGMSFRYLGRQKLVFNPVTNNLEAADGSAQPERHVYLAFKSRRQVSLMTRTTVGLAMPSVVLLPTREIINGMAIFRRGYVNEQRQILPQRVFQLYLHEMGHVLGLGHSSSMTDVMFPQLDSRTVLGQGDRDGAVDFIQPCPA